MLQGVLKLMDVFQLENIQNLCLQDHDAAKTMQMYEEHFLSQVQKHGFTQPITNIYCYRSDFNESTDYETPENSPVNSKNPRRDREDDDEEEKEDKSKKQSKDSKSQPAKEAKSSKDVKVPESKGNSKRDENKKKPCS